MLHSTYSILVLVSAFLIGCVEHTKSESSVSVNDSSDMQLRPPPLLLDSRMIERDSLFAEISISFSGVSTSITAEKDSNTDFWSAQLQVPTLTAFTISVTWYDLLDQQRLDLAISTSSFQPVNFPGELSITNQFSVFDSDNFDADSDSVTNLTERLNGSLPFDALSPASNSSKFFNVNPRGTYLFVESDCLGDQAEESTRILLSDIGVSAGSKLTMQRIGSYQPGENFDDDHQGLGAVFVGPSGFLEPGSGSTTTAFMSTATACSHLPTDINEDFDLDGSVDVIVPPSATEIRLTTSDSYWKDNSDPNGDYGVNIAFQNESPVPPDEVVVDNGTFPNGIWKSTGRRDTFFPDEGRRTEGTFGGGLMSTNTTISSYESHPYEDGGTATDACFHGGETFTWSVWPQTVTGFNSVGIVFAGSHESGMNSSVYSNGILETTNYYTYVGPVTTASIAEFHAEYANACTHPNH